MKKNNFNNRKQYTNGLSNIVGGLGGYNMLNGQAPVQNLESTYYNTRYDLFTLRRDNLNMRYSTDGIFRTLVQQPILDAMRGELTITTDILSNDEIEELKEYLDKNDILKTIQELYIWNRLFGGSALLIEAEGQEMSEDFSIKNINQGTKINFYAVDRWELSNTPYIYSNQMEQRAKADDFQMYYYGVKVNRDRIVLLKGIEAPSLVRLRLQGWGLSVVEPLIAPSNTYQKAINLVYELIDESKIDVYKLEDFKNSAITGDDKSIIDRIQLTNLLKNFQHAVVMDKEDEYEQKQLNLSGIVEILRELKLDICASMKMPMTKIWGLSANGFNSGEEDIKNYNAMVESEVRPQLYLTIKQVLKYICKSLFGVVPDDIKLNYPPLSVPSEEQLENAKDKEFARYKNLYDSKLLTSQELGNILQEQNILTYKTKMLNGELPEFTEGMPQEEYSKLDF